MAEHHSASEIRPEGGAANGKGADGKIRASHLLVKHKDSRRPSSWREVRYTLRIGMGMRANGCAGEYHPH